MIGDLEIQITNHLSPVKSRFFSLPALFKTSAIGQSCGRIFIKAFLKPFATSGG